MTEEINPAVLLAKKRWANKTEEERKAHANMMVAARRAKQKSYEDSKEVKGETPQ